MYEHDCLGKKVCYKAAWRCFFWKREFRTQQQILLIHQFQHFLPKLLWPVSMNITMQINGIKEQCSDLSKFWTWGNSGQLRTEFTYSAKREWSNLHYPGSKGSIKLLPRFVEFNSSKEAYPKILGFTWEKYPDRKEREGERKQHIGFRDWQSVPCNKATTDCLYSLVLRQLQKFGRES